MLGRLSAVWGVVGVLALLSNAMLRLGPRALEAIEGGLTPVQWGLMAVWVAIMAHAEGYRGFHRRFSPRVVARAQFLARYPTALRGALAPFFCMSLFGASRRGVIVARSLVAGIVGLIVLVRLLPQPWRGIIDAGVVVGLTIGSASVLYFVVRAMLGHAPSIDPDVEDGAGPVASV